MMETQKTFTDALIEIGGRRWQKNGSDRIYFNDLYTWMGLSVTAYKTGNVASAKLNGESISNTKARRIMQELAACKLYYDVAEGQFKTSGFANALNQTINLETAREITSAIREAAESLINEAQETAP